jgi:hypothetical protein
LTLQVGHTWNLPNMFHPYACPTTVWWHEFLQYHDDDDHAAIAPWLMLKSFSNIMMMMMLAIAPWLMLRVSPASSSWWQINASGRRNHWRNVSWNTKRSRRDSLCSSGAHKYVNNSN